MRKLVITGRDSAQSGWFDKKQAAAVIASGHFDLDRQKMSPEQLVAAFSDWSPIVRSCAAEDTIRAIEEATTQPESRSIKR